MSHQSKTQEQLSERSKPPRWWQAAAGFAIAYVLIGFLGLGPALITCVGLAIGRLVSVWAKRVPPALRLATVLETAILAIATVGVFIDPTSLLMPLIQAGLLLWFLLRPGFWSGLVLVAFNGVGLWAQIEILVSASGKPFGNAVLASAFYVGAVLAMVVGLWRTRKRPRRR